VCISSRIIELSFQRILKCHAHGVSEDHRAKKYILCTEKRGSIHVFDIWNYVSILCLSLSAFLCPVFQTDHKPGSAPTQCLTSNPEIQSLAGQASNNTDRASDSDDIYDGWDIVQLCPDEDPVDIIMKVKIENNDSMEGREHPFTVLQL